MTLLISIIGAILALLVIIVLHEMGHLFVARAFGIKILRFSVGFGKSIYKRIGKDGTEYVLALIPLGGYVKMLGEGDQEVPEHELHRAFNRKPLWVRMAVVLAGPITNFILAILVFWAAYLIGFQHVKPIVGRVLPQSLAAEAHMQTGDLIIKVGKERAINWQQVIMAMLASIGDSGHVDLTVQPQGSSQLVVRHFQLKKWKLDNVDPDVFQSLGMYPYVPLIAPIVAKVMPGSPAAKGGFQPNDEIKKVDNQPVTSWERVVDKVRQLPGKSITFEVLRNQQLIPLTMTVGRQNRQGESYGYLGVMVQAPELPKSMLSVERYNVLDAWKPAVIRTGILIKYNAIMLWKLVTTKLSVKTMGGPISIFQAAGQATHSGWEVYLSFIGFISLTVGFINLLPIPGLDGGHLLFQIVEGIMRRPIPDRVQLLGFRLGMLFVLFIVLNATINDLARLLG